VLFSKLVIHDDNAELCCGRRNKSLYSSNGTANSVCDKLWKATHIILVDFLYCPLSDLKVRIDGKTINFETNGAHIDTKYHIISSTTLSASNKTKEKPH